MDSVITQVSKESAADGLNGGPFASANNHGGDQLAPSDSPSTVQPLKPQVKSNFFTKLLNCCWCCCGGRRRSRRGDRTAPTSPSGLPQGPDLSGGSSLEEEHLVAAQHQRQGPFTNGLLGDNHHVPSVNSLPDSASLHQHSPPPGGYLLPQLHPDDLNRPCMVIDLDETLVHSSFKPIGNADFIVPVEIDGVIHQVYVAKRPYVDEFLQKMGQLYECVLFTASLAKYADPVADLLDKWGVFRCRLFRDACVFHRGNYVKDLNKLGRSLHRVVIVDNSPASYIFHPDNAVPVASWFDDTSDTELLYLIPFFERLSSVDNVYTVLRNSNHPFNNTLKEMAVNKENDAENRTDDSKQFDDNS